jgi:hypothetical protein
VLHQQQQEQQQPAQPVTQQGQAPSSPAAAAAAAAGRAGAVVGAPVTTPGVVKTKGARRGAIGPLLNRLRAEQAQQQGGGE